MHCSCSTRSRRQHPSLPVTRDGVRASDIPHCGTPSQVAAWHWLTSLSLRLSEAAMPRRALSESLNFGARTSVRAPSGSRAALPRLCWASLVPTPGRAESQTQAGAATAAVGCQWPARCTCHRVSWCPLQCHSGCHWQGCSKSAADTGCGASCRHGDQLGSASDVWVGLILDRLVFVRFWREISVRGYTRFRVLKLLKLFK
jgi:hypothetical protein